MVKISRTKAISFRKFNDIFTGRSFNIRYKLLRKIFLVEDIDGNYLIHEHPSILGYVAFAVFSLLAVFPILFVSGYIGLIDLKNEWVGLINKKPLRADELRLNKEKTIEVLSLVGWL
jgi:hypothetical protein